MTIKKQHIFKLVDLAKVLVILFRLILVKFPNKNSLKVDLVGLTDHIKKSPRDFSWTFGVNRRRN